MQSDVRAGQVGHRCAGRCELAGAPKQLAASCWTLL